jgi:hypothetical protein
MTLESALYVAKVANRSDKDPSVNREYRDEILYEEDPITGDLAQKLRHKIDTVYDYIAYKALYVSNKYLRIKIDGQDLPWEREYLQSGIIAAYILNRSATLVSGPSASGKTASLRYISRLMTGSSIENMYNIYHCDQESQRENWLGYLDPQYVMRGEGTLAVDWAPWIKDDKITDFIVDEIRLSPESFQTQMYTLMNDGRVQYGVKFPCKIPGIRLFMTENPSNQLLGVDYPPLPPPFLDRITQCLSVPSASAYAKEQFEQCRTDERQVGYSDDQFVEQVMRIEELNTASILAQKIPVDTEAKLYASYLSGDALLCLRAPDFDKGCLENTKPSRDGLCDGCHMVSNEWICQTFYGGTMRMFKDLIALGQAYAFWIGLPEVTKYVIHAIAPDVVTHRISIIDEKAFHDDLKNTFGSKRLFVQANYIDWCLNQLANRVKAHEIYETLQSGEGTDSDFLALKNLANNDLYVRLELLPFVSIGDGMRANLTTDYRSVFSAVNAIYKEENAKVTAGIEQMRATPDQSTRTAIANTLIGAIQGKPENRLYRFLIRRVIAAAHQADIQFRITGE